MAIQEQNYVKSVKAISCPSCGATLNILSKKSNFYNCQNCGSSLDIRSDEHKILDKLLKPSGYKPISFIRIGMSAKFDNKIYKVMGRTRWESFFAEKWVEGSYNGYSNERWIYDEWVLIAKDNSLFYLIEDKEGFHVSKSYIPKYPSLPQSQTVTINFDNPDAPQNITEIGHATVIYFEGETTYQIKTGDQVSFAMYKYGVSDMTVECRYDNYELQEVEFFEEIPISKTKVLTAFEADPLVSKYADYQVKNPKFLFLCFLAGTLMSLALWYYSLNSDKIVEELKIEVQKPTEEILSSFDRNEIVPFKFDSVYVVSSEGKSMPISDRVLAVKTPYTELNAGYSFAHLSIDSSYHKNSTITKKKYYYPEAYSKIFELEPNISYKFNDFNRGITFDFVDESNFVFQSGAFSSEYLSDPAFNNSFYNTSEFKSMFAYDRIITDQKLRLKLSPKLYLKQEETIKIEILKGQLNSTYFMVCFMIFLILTIFSNKISYLIFGNPTFEEILEKK